MQPEKTFQKIIDLLNSAPAEFSHPFRLFTLATTNPQNEPEARMIVLRDFDSENMTLTFYCDKRSPKVFELQNTPQCSMVFYHQELQIQLRIKAFANIIDDKEEHWSKISEYNKINYATTLSPGDAIEDYIAKKEECEDLAYSNFCIVNCKIHSIDYLKLHKEYHKRIKFERKSDWQGQFIVP